MLLLGKQELKPYKILEERLKVVKGFNIFGVDAMGVCLVPDVVIPQKFKTSEFEKYKGVSCPKNHLRMFVRKMGAYAANEKLMINNFQDSLSGGIPRLIHAVGKSPYQDLGGPS